MPTWSLTTLGTLRLTDDTTGEECLRGRRKELVLLAFLARRAPRPVQRVLLADLLWGDRDEDRARASLRQALSQLRRVLGDALDARSDTIALSANSVRLDVVEVEKAAAAERWRDVATRSAGDFLAGHDDLGGEAYRHWMHGERAKLARIAERAREAVSATEPPSREGAHVATVDSLPPPAAPAPTVSALPPTRRLRVRFAALAAVSACLVAGVALVRQSSKHTTTPQTVIVGDFRAVGIDSTLGDVATEALRVGLRQSHVLSVFPPSAFNAAVRRVRPQSARADVALSRQIAVRAGVKAVADGQIVGAGSRYLLSVRLIAAVSGQELAQYSAEAASPREILPAVDRLASQVRRGAGESLRSVESARPVERVTTSSLEALAKYVRATRALDLDGTPARGVALLEEAIALDSTFAMAYRRLAIELNDRGENAARVRDLITRGYALRARLADPERYAIEAAYYSFGPTPDEDKAIQAYQSALESDPHFGVGLINLSEIYLRRHQFARAESLSKVIVALGTGTIEGHVNLMAAQVSLGRLDAASATLAHFDSVSPGNPSAAIARARLLYARENSDSAVRVLRALFASSSDLARRQNIAAMLRDEALAHGRVTEGREWARLATNVAMERGVPGARLAGALDDAWITLWFDADTSAAMRQTRDALRANPLDSIPALDRPYGKLIELYAWSGHVSRARAVLAAYDSAQGNHTRLNARAQRPRYEGEIALADRRYADALADFRTADSTQCATCLLPLMAITYDRQGLADSAATLFRRYVETPAFYRLATDASFLPIARRAFDEAQRHAPRSHGR